MATVQQVFRRKPVPEMSAETGVDTGKSELERSIGLFQLSMFGVGATIGTGISSCCPRRSRSPVPR